MQETFSVQFVLTTFKKQSSTSFYTRLFAYRKSNMKNYFYKLCTM